MSNKAGNSKSGQAAEYKSSKRWETNRRRKLERALKSHPNNLQIVEAHKNISYRRCTPKTRNWTKTKIRLASLLKRFVGVCHQDMFSNNEKTSVPATLRSGPNSKLKPKPFSEKSMFSLGERVRYL